VEFVSDRSAEPPTGLSALIEAGRRRLLERGWHLAVCVTDLPRMRELGARTEHGEHGEHGVGFIASVITGNIWLLLGMLRANRPWRLALRHGLSHRRAATATASAGDRGPGPPRRRVPRIRAGRGG
jgi:hypothetical protein